MKTKISALTLALLFTILCAGPAFADTAKMIIKLKTNEFEIAATDISNLQVGDAETIVTDSGKIIDLLRTADGVEIYVDGEMLEIPDLNSAGLDGGMHTGLDGGMHTIIHKHKHLECLVDGDDESEWECADELAFFSDEDSGFEFLHTDGDAHTIIIIEQEADTVDL